MGPISAEIEIDVPRERVFAALANVAERPSFTDHFLTGFHLTRLESTGVGAGARFRAKGRLRSVWMDTAIAELDPPFQIVEEGRGGRGNRIPTRTVWELTEGPGRLTRVQVTHWTEAKGVDRVLEALSGAAGSQTRGWREALRRLREQLESDRTQFESVGVAGGNRHATGVR